MDLPPEEQPILQACTACGALLDVSEEAPFTQIYCPSCGQGLRARPQFNNFTLLELLGEGGMGSVFKANDCNLNRLVALKILKKECSANAEERARLETEARITASINHPHVVKVYSFGQDHGQFYLAMELVEKGSLDDLIGLQRRVPEIQVLEVGIQIAQGLEAAWERGLIHRDVKPGNILFADAHTAKIVDFGLAEPLGSGSADSEIWGTPYYIAPEKLDGQPEDFRSDIYSLGGTLFHALAGRPPFEAQTASLVALKHIKSQAVSLQAFAPDVSSETAYVINRMLHKNPDERYSSYAELIEHLSYARAKVLERAARPQQKRPQVALTTQSKSQQVFMAVMVGVFFLIVVALLGGMYVYRDRIFGLKEKAVAETAAGGLTREEIASRMSEARRMIVEGQYAEAESDLAALLTGEIPQPEKNWARLQQALALILNGQVSEAREICDQIRNDGLYSTAEQDNALANFFVETARLTAQPKEVSGWASNQFSNKNYEAFALLIFGLKDWEMGAFKDSAQLLEAFVDGEISGPEEWVKDYQTFARRYLIDAIICRDAAILAKNASSPEQKSTALKAIQESAARLKVGGKAAETLQEIQEKLQKGN